MKKNFLIALPLAATLIIPAAAQTSTQNDQQNQQQSGQISTGISNQSDQQQAQPQPGAQNGELGARQPLEPNTKQGFWGHLNPFARKKYVQRQLDPIRNRVNELDELTATNARGLKDLDARTTQGIQQATNRANEADQHALQAGQHAQQAHQTAQQATARLQTVEQVVGNIDDYKVANQAEVKFRSGQTTLSKSAKQDIDNMVQQLANQRGYVIQVQGFSPGKGAASIQSSQAMAQAVARYLVIEHQIPVYRIFVVGMGNAPLPSADGQAKKVRGGRVEVAVLKNGVDQLTQQASTSGTASNEGGVTGTQDQAQPATQQNSTPAPISGNASGAQSQPQGTATEQQQAAPANQQPWEKPNAQQQQQQNSNDQSNPKK